MPKATSVPMTRRQHIDAIAQCDRCNQHTSYDTLDAHMRTPLECRCGGKLRLFTFDRQEEPRARRAA